MKPSLDRGLSESIPWINEAVGVSREREDTKRANILCRALSRGDIFSVTTGPLLSWPMAHNPTHRYTHPPHIGLVNTITSPQVHRKLYGSTGLFFYDNSLYVAEIWKNRL
jgi:hypothetical protein